MEIITLIGGDNELPGRVSDSQGILFKIIKGSYQDFAFVRLVSRDLQRHKIEILDCIEPISRIRAASNTEKKKLEEGCEVLGITVENLVFLSKEKIKQINSKNAIKSKYKYL